MPPCTLLAGLRTVCGLSVQHGRCCGCLARRCPPAGPAPQCCSAGPFWVPQVMLTRGSQSRHRYLKTQPRDSVSHVQPSLAGGAGDTTPGPPVAGWSAVQPPQGYQLAAVPSTAEIFAKSQVNGVCRLHRTVGASPWSVASPFPARHLAVGFWGNIHNFVCPVLS